MSGLSEAEIRRVVEAVLDAENDKRAAAIDDVVLKAVATILTSFGIEEDDRKELRADFQHLRRWRKSVEQAQTLTFKAVVLAIASGVIGALWLGIKTIVALKS
jgi:hypothetical protein